MSRGARTASPRLSCRRTLTWGAGVLRSSEAAKLKELAKGADFSEEARSTSADLVLLDVDPRADIANARRIRALLTRRVYDRAALDQFLANAERAACR